MNSRIMQKIGLCFLAVFLLVPGCAGISRQAESLVTYEGPFSVIQARPEEYRGEVIMVGGRIIDLASTRQGSEIAVLQMPLGYDDRPEQDERSLGRFLIRYEGFVDPAVYEAGKLVTVVGRVIGAQVRRIDEYDYTYPVLEPIETKLWKRRSTAYPSFHFGIGVGTWF